VLQKEEEGEYNPNVQGTAEDICVTFVFYKSTESYMIYTTTKIDQYKGKHLEPNAPH